MLHIEVGIADSVEVRLYDVAGDLRLEKMLSDPPAIVEDGEGPKDAYETPLETDNLGPGVYVYAVRARKNGEGDLRTIGKAAVIK